MDNIKVKGSIDGAAVNVATDDVGGVHYPIYKFAIGPDGEATLIGEDNPIPVTASEDAPVAIESIRLYDLTRDIRDVNQEILKQLKLMNAHFAEWDGIEGGDV